MTQLETLEMMRNVLMTNNTLKLKGGYYMDSYHAKECLDNLDQMIKTRTKTPEQREKDNERRRIARAKKRAERDEEILTLIAPYLDQPCTASLLEAYTNGAVKAGEIRSYFQRHARDEGVVFSAPRTEWAYQIRV